jgi:hypothetical protein
VNCLASVDCAPYATRPLLLLTPISYFYFRSIAVMARNNTGSRPKQSKMPSLRGSQRTNDHGNITADPHIGGIDL